MKGLRNRQCNKKAPGIENNLYSQLDLTLEEDESRKVKMQQGTSTITKIALSILKKDKTITRD